MHPPIRFATIVAIATFHSPIHTIHTASIGELNCHLTRYNTNFFITHLRLILRRNSINHTTTSQLHATKLILPPWYNKNMKIILGSCGLSTEPIIRTCENLVKKSRENINIIIINEAIKGESGDHHWFIEELQHLSKIIGGNIEFIDIQAHPLKYIEQRIAIADIVYCLGGNTDYLANTFIKTGFDGILPTILAKKVWVGSSAGSCVLCHKESEEIQKTIYKEKRETDHFTDIIPIIFLPHLHGFYKFDKKEVEDASMLTSLPVYALSDKAAIIVNDDDPLKIIGEDYLIAKNGKITAQD